MRHLVLLSAVLAFGGASAAAARTPQATTGAAGERCQRSDVILAKPREAPRADKLGELPPGNLLLSVLRGTKGCYVPVIVRKGYGGPDFNQGPEGGMSEPVKVRPRRD